MLTEEVAAVRASLPRSVTIEKVIKAGDPTRTIALQARTVQAELIVMGRGGGRLRDAFIGSTAERVIRATRRPVLAVRLAARTSYKKPALADAFDDTAPNTLAIMQRLLAPAPAQVTVIHEVDTPYHGIVYPSVSRDEAEHFDGELEMRAGSKMAKLFVRQSVRPRQPGALRWKPYVGVSNVLNV